MHYCLVRFNKFVIYFQVLGAKTSGCQMALQPNFFGLTRDTLIDLLADRVSPYRLSRLRRGDQFYLQFRTQGGKTLFRVYSNSDGVLTVRVFGNNPLHYSTFRVRSVLIDRKWIQSGLQDTSTLLSDLIQRRSYLKLGRSHSVFHSKQH